MATNALPVLRWLPPGVAFVRATLLVLATGVGAACSPSPSENTITSVAEVLSEREAEGFDRITGPRPLRFPEDHGPHRAQQIEWWYFTGNLKDPGGRPFGFEVTFFRIGWDPDPPPRESRWGTGEISMSHFAVTDIQEGDFVFFERLNRNALGLAGAEGAPFRVWNEDWSVRASAGNGFPWTLRASEEGTSLELTLSPEKPMVLQGDAGYSRKGRDVGNASLYYSYPRLRAEGFVRREGESYPVRGRAWMDHEWSTSVLDDDLAGWDWFALQLSDGTDLMVYELRGRDGVPGPRSAGTFVGQDGTPRKLSLDEYEIEVEERWRSPSTGITYPSRWTLRVPALELVLRVEPVLSDQELRLATCYWEGAVAVTGRRAGEALTGEGYVELVGYETP